jgi:hypothetical protein
MSRNENATLKKLRKQQEASLSEMLAHKEELLQWVAGEKARTAAWCALCRCQLQLHLFSFLAVLLLLRGLFSPVALCRD